MRDGCQRRINSHGPKCLFVVVVHKIVKGTNGRNTFKKIFTMHFNVLHTIRNIHYLLRIDVPDVVNFT